VKLARFLPPAACLLALSVCLCIPPTLSGQGVTTAAMSGIVADTTGSPLVDANVVAVHVPSGTQYRAVSRAGGAYNVPGMRVGGPYRVTATRIGYRSHTEENVYLALGQDLRVDFGLVPQAVELEAVQATGTRDEVLNAGRTGAATFIDPGKVEMLPSVKRSTRDLIRVDPRNDGNYAFAGRNWLYNNISLDGSYFNNPFGLDDPAPGGQTAAEPVPYDAVEQVQVSVAPFDVRQGGFTGANVNTVTKSGTNEYHATAYGFGRNQSLLGNTVSGQQIVANPNLSYTQAGASVSGPLVRDKLFFFVNGEIVRSDDPGSDFAASVNGSSGLGISRVDAKIMDSIRARMISAYNYDPGAYQGYLHHTDNDKLIAKLDWNVNPNNALSIRWDYLKAKRDLGPHPFVLSFNNTGRGPNASSLPFENSGYAINNHLNSFALELNSRSSGFANRFFASYNRFRDFREPFSPPFPTIEIGQSGVTYTTLGHEPFSIHNILDQYVWQFTDNFSWFKGKHVVTLGANFESFWFYNSFNIFRDGVFFLPAGIASGTTFDSLAQFFSATDPSNPNQIKFNSFIGTGPYKGEEVSIGQLGFYLQDEYPVSERLNLTYGLRVDFPMYFTNPIDNPFSRGLTALDANGNPETVDQSQLPSATPLWAPRLGFNWNASGDRRTQVRGGTGIFTGRVPFVWIGNVISNPGANPNLFPASGAPIRPTGSPGDSSTLAQSFDINAVNPNFKWPQVWTSDLAVDHQLPGGLLGTLEVIYGKDIHSIVMRNADLRRPVSTVPGPDGRPFYGNCTFASANCPTGSSAGGNSLNGATLGGAGIYVLDNTNEGHSINLTAQLRKNFESGVSASLAYSFTDARNNLKSTEIASVLWQNEPVKGDPNNPELGYSEFGQRHRIIGTATYVKAWSPTLKTRVGVFVEVGEGNVFAGNGGNRYSFIYSGDVNGDGQGGNDLIYIPRSQSEITFDTCNTGCGANVTPAQQWAALNAFINQDGYLSTHRGQIADRFGEPNPWYQDVDLRVLQEFSIGGGTTRHQFELSMDILNVGNLINSSWGVRKVADPAATSPLKLTAFDANGTPHFNFTGPATTFIDDPSLLSRWQIQLGLRYILN
jgi:hypothetical protein